MPKPFQDNPAASRWRRIVAIASAASGVGPLERNPTVAEFAAALQQRRRVAAKPDRNRRCGSRVDARGGDRVPFALVRQAVFAPEFAQQLDLLGLPPAARVEVFVQCFVFDGVPTGADAETKPAVRQQRDLRRLFCDEHRLPLRQDQHAAHHVELRRHPGDERERRQRFVERDVLVVAVFAPAAGSVRIGAHHVVVDQQVRRAQGLGALRERLHRAGVVADLVVRKNDAEFHAVLVGAGGSEAVV